MRCDAGWGLITGVEKGSGAAQDAPSGKVHVRLRPSLQAEKVVLDLDACTMTFPGKEQVYVCGRCGHFASADQNAVLKKHGLAAHGGVGNTVQARPGSEVHWRHGPRFQRQAPKNEWE